MYSHIEVEAEGRTKCRREGDDNQYQSGSGKCNGSLGNERESDCGTRDKPEWKVKKSECGTRDKPEWKDKGNESCTRGKPEWKWEMQWIFRK